jgi:hypothetical protein
MRDMVGSFYIERLPYIDEHSTCVGAPPERTWAALIAVGAGMRGPAGPLGWLMRLEPALASGDWSRGVEAGATLPGFVVEQACPPSRLALVGRHRFSRYALVFELENRGPDGTRVRARSWGAFLGLHGRAYRALVIGSGAHRLVVRRLLRRIEERACSA